ncbi:hypothetical protein K3728_06150 [Rhodobacteraceae bacterium M385]|nr:hypothetical protein K3728_06150 [Rhodobacteraceae bacterium M385]
MTHVLTASERTDATTARSTIRNAQPALTGYIGLAALVGCFIIARTGAAFTDASGFLQACSVMFIAMALCDLIFYRVYKQPDVGGLALRPQFSSQMFLILFYKVVGVAASFATAWILYSFLPIYQDVWYQETFIVLQSALPYALPFFSLYLLTFHFISLEPDDGLAEFGRLCLSCGHLGDRKKAADYALGILIKMFFVPIMVGFGLGDWLRLSTITVQIDGFRDFYELSYQLVLLIDVCFGAIGYLCSFRLLSAHVRFPERTLGGWMVCIMCYVPFWQIINRNYLNYSDGVVWGNVFVEASIPYAVWGSAILFLMTVYALSTVSFGYRFSNLTYRGVVCSGPYKFTRHPAYLSKNISYWMIEIPILGTTLGSAVSGTLALLAVNLIYYVRARYEEKCCLQHEDYKIYYARFK